VTLNAQGDPNAVFIFQIGSLTTGSNTSVLLINGAQACNVFWQVGSSVTLGPARSPDGSTGWIVKAGTRELVTGWRILVDLGARRVTVYHDGRGMKAFKQWWASPPRRPPTGQFFVEETVQMEPGEADGPFALALSVRSNVLQEFEGGPGQIGIHGREGLGETLGRAESHGCILATVSIDWLAARIGPGTPARIY
jgi:lipoprotein-anchoring transpeptidase ErfK/SrfK